MHLRWYNSKTCITEISIINYGKEGAPEFSLYNRSKEDPFGKKEM